MRLAYFDEILEVRWERDAYPLSVEHKTSTISGIDVAFSTDTQTDFVFKVQGDGRIIRIGRPFLPTRDTPPIEIAGDRGSDMVRAVYDAGRAEWVLVHEQHPPAEVVCRTPDHFRTIIHPDGQTDVLTPDQAAILDHVASAYPRGRTFAWASVLEGVGVLSEKFRGGAFRSRPEAWDRLFERAGKGLYRLRVTIVEDCS